MGNYYVFLILLIIISLITYVTISIVEGKLRKEIEAEEDALQTKTNISIVDVSLPQINVCSNNAATQTEACFNTKFFIPPVVTNVAEEGIGNERNEEVFDNPVLISSELCEEILEDSEREDII